MLSKKRLVFPQFSNFEFNDVIVNPGQISLKLLHDVQEKDRKLDANLRKAPKLTNKVLHPGKYKQNVQLALDIFHETTVAATSSYFPNCNDELVSLNFLILGGQFQIQKISIVLLIILVAIQNDNKLRFLREMAAWLKRWDNSKIPNCEKLLSAQTSFLTMDQKQPPRGVFTKRCSENMLQIYRKTLMPKCVSISCKATLLKSHFGMGVFLQICCIFSKHFFLENLWVAASEGPFCVKLP